MQVILIHPVKKLGKIGEQVNVKPGFARNYLIPQKIAIRATKENQEYIIAQKHALEEKNSDLKSKAEAIAKIIEGKDLIFIKQTSDDGRLYGSVSNKDIANILSEAGKHHIIATQIALTAPLKNVGFYKSLVNLHPEVTANINISIGRNEAEAQTLLQNKATDQN